VATVPQVGDQLHLRAHVQLNGLQPNDVTVEVVYGKSLGGDDLTDVHTMALSDASSTGETAGTPSVASAVAGSDTATSTLFTGSVSLNRAGGFGYTVRIVPRNDLLVSPAEMGLVAIAG
jgi:starch phosphorylase